MTGTRAAWREAPNSSPASGAVACSTASVDGAPPFGASGSSRWAESLAAFFRRSFGGAAGEPPSLAAACSSGPFSDTGSAVASVAVGPAALAEASASVVAPAASADFAAVVACPRDDAMSAGSAAVSFASAAFFASAALVAATPRAAPGYCKTFVLALQGVTVSLQNLPSSND
jgi:hypothetical protein